MFIVVLFLIGSITSHMQTKFEKKSRNFIVAPYHLVLHNYNRSYTAEIKWYRGNSPYLTTESRRCKPTISSPLSMISRWFTVNSWQMNTIYEIGQSEWINAWLFTRSRIYSVEVNLWKKTKCSSRMQNWGSVIEYRQWQFYHKTLDR